MTISGISSSFSQNALSPAGTSYQQELQNLGKDLQAGNISAAQKDFSSIQQSLQNSSGTNSNGTGEAKHASHHHHLSGGGRGNSSEQNSLLQELSQVGQSLTSGNLYGARQAYTAVQQQLQQAGLGGGASPTRSPLSFET
jgi:hypothetical protein